MSILFSNALYHYKHFSQSRTKRLGKTATTTAADPYWGPLQDDDECMIWGSPGQPMQDTVMLPMPSAMPGFGMAIDPAHYTRAPLGPFPMMGFGPNDDINDKILEGDEDETTSVIAGELLAEKPDNGEGEIDEDEDLLQLHQHKLADEEGPIISDKLAKIVNSIWTKRKDTVRSGRFTPRTPNWPTSRHKKLMSTVTYFLGSGSQAGCVTLMKWPNLLWTKKHHWTEKTSGNVNGHNHHVSQHE